VNVTKKRKGKKMYGKKIRDCLNHVFFIFLPSDFFALKPVSHCRVTSIDAPMAQKGQLLTAAGVVCAVGCVGGERNGKKMEGKK